jgi:hypothetical protein
MDSEEQQLGTWQSPDAQTYAVVASKLIALAEEAETPELKLQYGQLAVLYEQLANYAIQLAHKSRRTSDRHPKSRTVH